MIYKFLISYAMENNEYKLKANDIIVFNYAIDLSKKSTFDQNFIEWNEFSSYETFIEQVKNEKKEYIDLCRSFDNINFWIRQIATNGQKSNNYIGPNEDIDMDFKSLPKDNEKINDNLLKVIQFIPYGILCLNHYELATSKSEQSWIMNNNFYFFNFFRLIIDKKPDFFNQIIEEQLKIKNSLQIFQETYDKFSQLKNIFEQNAKETKIISTESSKYIKLFEKFFGLYFPKNSKDDHESEDHESEEFENNKQKLNEQKDSFEFSNNQQNSNPITLSEINNKIPPILIYVILLMNIIILFYNLYNLYIILIKNKNN